MVLAQGLYDFAIKVASRVVASETQRVTGESTFKVIHSHGACCWQESTVPPHVGFSTGCLGEKVPGFAQGEQFQRELDHNLFYDLALEVTHCNFYTIPLVTGSNLFRLGEDYTRV